MRLVDVAGEHRRDRQQRRVRRRHQRRQDRGKNHDHQPVPQSRFCHNAGAEPRQHLIALDPGQPRHRHHRRQTADKDDQRGGKRHESHEHQRALEHLQRPAGVEPLDRLGIDGRSAPQKEDVADPCVAPLQGWHLDLGRIYCADLLHHRRQPSPQFLGNDEYQDEKSRQQHYSLHHVGPGHAAHSTQGFVDHHDDCQSDDPIGRGHRPVGDPFHRCPHRLELGQGVVAQRVDHHRAAEQRQQRRAETVGYVIPGRDESMLSRQDDQPGGKEQVADDDRKHEDDRAGPRKADPVGFAGVPKERVATVLCGVQRQKEHQQSHGTAGQVEIGHAVALPLFAGDPAHPDHRQQVEPDRYQGPCPKDQRGGFRPHQRSPSSTSRQ